MAPRSVPPIISACTGKNAGDSCSVSGTVFSFTGTCTATPVTGILACLPPHVVINEVQITPTNNRGYLANMRQPHVKV